MSRPTRHTVEEPVTSDRLDRYLLLLFPDHSRAQIQRWITQGKVSRLSGKTAQPLKASYRVRSGDRLEIEPPSPQATSLKGESIPLKVLHEDAQLLVLDKPAGLVVHPAPGHRTGTLVHALLGRQTRLSSISGSARPGIVHRLDKDTSGILVVAKDDKTHRSLSRQFAQGKVRRVYLALVQGVVRQDEGTIEAPIGRHATQRQQMAVRYGSGRQALTRYRVRKRFPKATFLELFPETGRTHQLRVHLKHLGHPILGDARYGIQAGLTRQALHAHRLGFEHPAQERWMEFVSAWPRALARAASALE